MDESILSPYSDGGNPISRLFCASSHRAYRSGNGKFARLWLPASLQSAPRSSSASVLTPFSPIESARISGCRSAVKTTYCACYYNDNDDPLGPRSYARLHSRFRGESDCANNWRPYFLAAAYYAMDSGGAWPLDHHSCFVIHAMHAHH